MQEWIVCVGNCDLHGWSESSCPLFVSISQPGKASSQNVKSILANLFWKQYHNQDAFSSKFTREPSDLHKLNCIRVLVGRCNKLLYFASVQFLLIFLPQKMDVLYLVRWLEGFCSNNNYLWIEALKAKSDFAFELMRTIKTDKESKKDKYYNIDSPRWKSY